MISFPEPVNFLTSGEIQRSGGIDFFGQKLGFRFCSIPVLLYERRFCRTRRAVFKLSPSFFVGNLSLVLLSRCFLSESHAESFELCKRFYFLGTLPTDLLRKSIMILAAFDPRYLHKELCNSFFPRFSSAQQRMVNIRSQNFATTTAVAEFCFRSVRGFSCGVVSR